MNTNIYILPYYYITMTKTFELKCKYCGKRFVAMHKKQVDYQKEIHEMYCIYKNKPIVITEDGRS